MKVINLLDEIILSDDAKRVIKEMKAAELTGHNFSVRVRFKSPKIMEEAAPEIGILLSEFYRHKSTEEPYATLDGLEIVDDPQGHTKSEKNPEKISYVLWSKYPNVINNVARPNANRKLHLCYFNITPSRSFQIGIAYRVQFSRRNDDFKVQKFAFDLNWSMREAGEFCTFMNNALQVGNAYEHR